MTVPEVRVLVEGMIRRDGKAILEAHSSSTLVSVGAPLMVVDTSSAEYRPRLLAALEARGVDPKRIKLVVNTHPHHDHTGSNELFPNAEVLVYDRRLEGDIELGAGISVVPTPGHTRGSVSVFVAADRKYAIVGDAMPTEDNYRRWLPPGLNYDPEEALRSMRRIAEFADVVIPGHGAPFALRKK